MVGSSQGKAPMRPRWAEDMPSALPSNSKPRPIIKKKQRMYPKPPEKLEKIAAMLSDPLKRCHLGPCCFTNTKDGCICGTKKWGDGKGSKYADGTIFFECFGCRGELEEPSAGVTADDLEMDAASRVAVDKALAAAGWQE
jgi:hypothetical protein